MVGDHVDTDFLDAVVAVSEAVTLADPVLRSSGGVSGATGDVSQARGAGKLDINGPRLPRPRAHWAREHSLHPVPPSIDGDLDLLDLRLTTPCEAVDPDTALADLSSAARRGDQRPHPELCNG